MKTYNLAKILLVGCGFLSISSCTKLKDDSYTTIISNQFQPTGDDLASLLGTAYSSWRFLLLDWDGLWRAQELSGDQQVIPARPNGWVDGGVYKRIHQHTWTADEGIVVQTWNRTFSGITNCNRIIYQIESGMIPVAENKEAVIAELKVLRAAYYAILCDIYGNVPIVTKFDLPEGFLPEQNSRKEVYDFIVKEIESNIHLLSDKNDQTTYGKFNKWAANALLARVYLNAEVYSGTAQWQKVIASCDAIINSGAGYILENNQKNVFVTDNQNSKEIVFALPLDENYTNNWNAFDLHMQSLPSESQATYNLLSAPWGGMCAVPQFISSFDKDDIRKQRNWIQGQQYSAAGQPLVVGLGAYKDKPLNLINEVPSIDASEAIHGFRLGKFEIKQGAAVQLSNDYPIFRYAEVLMMKAEALLRTGKADEAAQLVTQIRQRAFPDYPAKALVTGSELQAGSSYDYGQRDSNGSTKEGGADIKYGRFLDELGWEFDQEAHRRTDLIRFGVFSTKSWFSHKATKNANRNLFPIPRPALNTNSNLVQNPGY
mgnify:CR=1 FL=1